MKKSVLPIKTQSNGVDEKSISTLVDQIRTLVQTARRTAVTVVDSLQVATNFEIGRMILEQEQQGTRRAEYGKMVLKALSERLTSELGRGYSEDNLSNMRRFFLVYKDTFTGISEKPSRKSRNSGTSSLKLSWSHYVFLCRINDKNERRFYEIESADNGWSLPELRRQFDSGLYERLALSRDKDGVRKLAQKGQIITKPQDVIKNPYVLEFLGLDEKARYSESELETAIIDKLEQFLLELGKGFLFEARQKRFTFGEEHFFVDLVFYNRLLHCYVLIDLKIGKLTHQDLGQMQMYVNYFDRHVRLDKENQTVGIILCKKKHDAMVEITLPKKANIYASQYQLYLPSKEDLKQRLMEWAEEAQPQ
jgi:predicted nuclease of restriction endonuclease-like (RecB) superfamily